MFHSIVGRPRKQWACGKETVKLPFHWKKNKKIKKGRDCSACRNSGDSLGRHFTRSFEINRAMAATPLYLNLSEHALPSLHCPGNRKKLTWRWLAAQTVTQGVPFTVARRYAVRVCVCASVCVRSTGYINSAWPISISPRVVKMYTGKHYNHI